MKLANSKDLIHALHALKILLNFNFAIISALLPNFESGCTTSHIGKNYIRSNKNTNQKHTISLLKENEFFTSRSNVLQGNNSKTIPSIICEMSKGMNLHWHINGGKFIVKKIGDIFIA